MALSIGARLGPYEIKSALGAGGMGEVYQAHDKKLNRDVAIKVLLPTVADDPERMARFSREAQVLASLNHPNVAHVYGLEDAQGIKALVLELVEGPTLAERIAQRPMPVAEALPIAKQIADALEAAHEQGIIHRDLKPANIKVKPDGTVKVLDFGLAKALLDPLASSSADAMNSPTLSAHATKAGIILGTAAYMSPEQARGKAVDKRSDIWAFGCVLFEMLSGRLAFAGETISDTIASVLGSDPDWSRLPDTTPPSLRRILQRCLEKDPRRRLRDMGDVRLEIDEAQSGSPREIPVVQSASRRRERLAWIAGVALVTLLAGVLAVRALRPASPAAEMRFEITTPPTSDLVSLAISPDGQKIVFVATSEARSRLWLRWLNSGSAQPWPGTEAASFPFWSPDSRSVGFFADGKLKRIDIDGGSATVLANAPFGHGGTWNREGVVLFAPVPASPIIRISATGGDPTVVTKVEAPQQVGHAFPQFLPDGRHFLYYVNGAPDASGVYIGELGGTVTKRLLDADAAAVYAPSGQLLFVRQGTLLAQEFDQVRAALVGNPFPLAAQVAVQSRSAALSASSTGLIVYRIGSAGALRQPTWFDQSGKELETLGDLNTARDLNIAMTAPSLSPDGRRVAFFAVDGNADIWLLEIGRGVRKRLTADAADDIFPVWSPDGARIAFSSTRKGGLDLYVKSTSGLGDELLLLATPQLEAASDWSPDGRFLLYTSASLDFKKGIDIWALPMDGDRKPFPIVQSEFSERLGQFSPDARWIAYESDESGRYEIYVQPFLGSGVKAGGVVPISNNGGAQVRWRPDGKALFYMALDNRLMVVPIGFSSNGQDVEPGAPVPLFTTRIVGGAVQSFPRYQYTVSSDGRRFLMNVEPTPVVSPITVLLNWAGQKK